MAKFNMSGIDEFAKMLENAGKLDEIAPTMIEESLPILEASLKGVVQQETDRGYATGALVKSIKKTGFLRNAYGYFGVVRPTGKDKNGVRNMEKLAYLHYGTSKQMARPVVTKAIFQVRQKIIEQMQEVYNREVGI